MEHVRSLSLGLQDAGRRAADVAWLAAHSRPAKTLRVLRIERRPVLVMGCGRSGTTFVQSVLSAHRRLFPMPRESHFLMRRPGDSARFGYRSFNYRELYERMRPLAIPEACTRLVEKTPRHVRRLEAILRYYGDRVSVVLVIRDGRDVVTSIHPRHPERTWVRPERWIDDVKAGLAFADDPRVTTLRYEDLVTDFEATARSLCRAIGERWDPAILRYPASARLSSSWAWEGRAARAPDPSSIGRWRTMTENASVRAIREDPEAARLLAHYGYPPD